MKPIIFKMSNTEVLNHPSLRRNSNYRKVFEDEEERLETKNAKSKP